MDQKIGSYAFIIGVVLAIVLGIVSAAGMELTAIPEGDIMVWLPLVLVILGIIVGFLNVGDKEVQPFLLAAIALVIVGTVADISMIPLIGNFLWKIVSYIAIFAAPAALIVAILEFYKLAGTPKGTQK